MLSYQTIYPNTLELLKTLAQKPILSNMRLVGGTALALQYGHRRSVDLDFFDDADLQPIPYMFSDVTWESIKEKILLEVERYTLQNS